MNRSDRVNYKQNRYYNLCVRHLQVSVKSYGQHMYLLKTLKYSRPKFYANATLLSPVLCCKHYISMFLDEYLTKLWFPAKNSHKNTPTPLTLRSRNEYAIFSKYISFVMCTECQVLIKAQKYSCQSYLILATDYQN